MEPTLDQLWGAKAFLEDVGRRLAAQRAAEAAATVETPTPSPVPTEAGKGLSSPSLLWRLLARLLPAPPPPPTETPTTTKRPFPSAQQRVVYPTASAGPRRPAGPSRAHLSASPKARWSVENFWIEEFPLLVSETGEARLLLLGGTPQGSAQLRLILLRLAALIRWHRTTSPHLRKTLWERLLWIHSLGFDGEIPEPELLRLQKKAHSLLNSCWIHRPVGDPELASASAAALAATGEGPEGANGKGSRGGSGSSGGPSGALLLFLSPVLPLSPPSPLEVQGRQGVLQLRLWLRQQDSVRHPQMKTLDTVHSLSGVQSWRMPSVPTSLPEHLVFLARRWFVHPYPDGRLVGVLFRRKTGTEGAFSPWSLSTAHFPTPTPPPPPFETLSSSPPPHPEWAVWLATDPSAVALCTSVAAVAALVAVWGVVTVQMLRVERGALPEEPSAELLQQRVDSLQQRLEVLQEDRSLRLGIQRAEGALLELTTEELRILSQREERLMLEIFSLDAEAAAAKASAHRPLRSSSLSSTSVFSPLAGFSIAASVASSSNPRRSSLLDALEDTRRERALVEQCHREKSSVLGLLWGVLGSGTSATAHQQEKLQLEALEKALHRAREDVLVDRAVTTALEFAERNRNNPPPPPPPPTFWERLSDHW